MRRVDRPTDVGEDALHQERWDPGGNQGVYLSCWPSLQGTLNIRENATPYLATHQEGDNPFNNIESYDNFFYAALQVAIISTQTGVCSHFQLICLSVDTIL